MQAMARATIIGKTKYRIRSGRDLPAKQVFNDAVRLVEVSSSATAGEYSAHVNGELIVWSSRQPLLDAARALLDKGADSNAWLIMRHAGSSTDSLRGKIGLLAKLTVKQPDRGSPHFAKYVPFTVPVVPARHSEGARHEPCPQ
jgi:hypothetical protein